MPVAATPPAPPAAAPATAAVAEGGAEWALPVAVELRDSGRGRCVVAAAPLPAGRQWPHRCAACFASAVGDGELMRCAKCRTARYCS
eukprot:gene24631-5591_t